MTAHERLARAVSGGGPTMPLRAEMLEVLRERDALLRAGEAALAEACACDECGALGVRYFTTEGDGPFWLCAKVRIGDQYKGTHAMPERYAGEEVEAPDRPLDVLRAAIAAAKGTR